MAVEHNEGPVSVHKDRPAAEDQSGAAAEEILYEAVLTPHRSLGPKGFSKLLAGLAVVSLGLGFLFWSLGAWPVIGFFGLDIVLLVLAFRASYAQAALIERVRLGRRVLGIVRVWPSGRVEEWRLPADETIVELLGDRGAPNRLCLRTGTHRISIGGFLSPSERFQLAAAIRGALALRPAPRPAAARS